MTPRLDPRAIAEGALLSIALVVPPAVTSQIIVDEDRLRDSNWIFAFTGLILLGFFVGGVVAGLRGPAAPYSHGALAALAAFVIVQGSFLVVGALDLVDSRVDVELAPIVFTSLLATSCGALGGIVADRRERRVLREMEEGR